MTDKPHTEQNPYHMAVYLAELIKAAEELLDRTPNAERDKTGVGALITVIKERADALALELDRSIFCDGWPALQAALERDPMLGLEW